MPGGRNGPRPRVRGRLHNHWDLWRRRHNPGFPPLHEKRHIIRGDNASRRRSRAAQKRKVPGRNGNSDVIGAASSFGLGPIGFSYFCLTGNVKSAMIQIVFRKVIPAALSRCSPACPGEIGMGADPPRAPADLLGSPQPLPAVSRGARFPAACRELARAQHSRLRTGAGTAKRRPRLGAQHRRPALHRPPAGSPSPAPATTSRKTISRRSSIRSRCG